MAKRTRRTKAEMELARSKVLGETTQGNGFRDIFDVLEESPKPKKKQVRRTKAQIAKDNAKLAKEEEEKYSVPKNNTVFLDRPVKSKIPPVLKPSVNPQPRVKFDGDLVGEKLGLGTGLILGRVDMKKEKNFHIMSWNNIDKDWRIMYDGRHNTNEDQIRVWNSFSKIKETYETPPKKELDNGRNGKSTQRKRSSKVNAD